MIYKYAKILLQIPEFDPALKVIFSKGQTATNHFKAFEADALNELKNRSMQIADYIDRHYINNSSGTDYLKQFYNQLEKYKNQFHRNLFYPVENALNALLSEEC